MSTIALSGNLTKDGQLTQFTNKQGAVGYVYRNTLAVPTRQDIPKTDKATGEVIGKDKLTSFISIVVWGDRAKAFPSLYKMGDTAHLTGELMPREVQRQDGTRYQSFEFKVDGELNQNQARDLRKLAFNMTHPNYVAQRAVEEQIPDAEETEENDFGDYDDIAM